jgi:Mce-associated membrane protein
MTRLLHLGRSRNPSGPGDATEDGTTGERDGDSARSCADGGPGTDGEHATEADPGTEPGTGTEVGAEPDQEASTEEPSETRDGGGRPGTLVRRLVPAVGAALLVLAGCGFFYGAHQMRSTPSAENHALTDAEATTRVAGDVGNALARVFSYTPDGLDATERAARSVLAGRAERQYTELMGRVRADLAEQRVTLSTQAVRTGVIELDGDSARLLVFLDQISHRGKAGTTSAAAQLTVTARWEEDQWRIVDIRTR